MQHLDDALRLIDGRAEIAGAESFCFGQRGECLRQQQRVAGSIEKRQQIVVAGIGIAKFAPLGEAVEVGAERQHDRRFHEHGLVEVEWGKALFHCVVARDDDAIQLHVPHCRCPCGIVQQPRDEHIAHVVFLILSDGSSFVEIHDVSCLSVYKGTNK